MYGLAYHICDRDEWVCYPIPFNKIVQLWRWLVDFITAYNCPSVLEQSFRRGYSIGFEHGKDTGAKIKERGVEELVSKAYQDGYRDCVKKLEDIARDYRG